MMLITRQLILVFIFLLQSFYVLSQDNKIDSLKNILNNKNNKEQVEVYFEIGELYSHNKDFVNSISYLSEGLKKAEKLKNDSLIALFNMELAAKYNYMEAVDKSFPHSLKALKYFEQKKDTINIVNCYMDISYVYNVTNNNEDNLVILNKAIKLAKAKNLNRNVLIMMNNIGVIYNKNKQYHLALETYIKANNMYINDTKNKDIHTSIKVNIAINKNMLGETQAALDSINKVIDIYKNTKDYFTLTIIYQAKAAFLKNMNLLDSTIIYYKKAIAISKKIAFNKDLTEIYLFLSKTYKQNNNIVESYKYLEKYNKLIDSLDIDKQINNINKIMFLYSINNKETEIKNLEYFNKLSQEKLKSYKVRLISLIIFSILLLFIFIGFLIFRLKINRAYSKLVQSNISELTYKKELIKFKQQLNVSDIDLFENVNYLNSPLSIEERKRIVEAINNSLYNNKVYLDAELSLEKLIKIIGTNRTYISQVLKENFDANYTEIINKLRVDEAKSLLLSNYSKDFTIDSLAEKVGYNSVATFYRAFKKYTGVTPMFFLKNIKDTF